jgi:hypothetical protein
MNYMNFKWCAFIVLVSLLPVQGYCLPSSSDGAQARRIVHQVELISRRCGGLDDLGRNTLKQSTVLMKMGPSAVYVLSNSLTTPDWKVRFWIADLMGYLGNADAQRPLFRLLQNQNENIRVRRQAYRSLRKLKIVIPAELKRGL